jgi:hypothetical protein
VPGFGNRLSARGYWYAHNSRRCTGPAEVPIITGVPGGVTARTVMLLSAAKEASSTPCATSHTRTILSSPPETARRPSALTATEVTPASWPVRVCTAVPASRSHTRTILSSPPETARRPSALAGDGAATRIEWAWDAVKHGPGPAPTGQARIMLLLANSADPMTAQLIASKTGLKYSVTRVLLSRMVRRGELVSPSRGTYTTPRAQKASA